LAMFFSSPALTGVTIALAVSLFVESFVTIVCLVRARRRVGGGGVVGEEGRNDENRGGRGGENARKEGEGWRFWLWGRGTRKGEEAKEKRRRDGRARTRSDRVDRMVW